jgi:hypothetical protein
MTADHRLLMLYWAEPFRPLRPTIRQHLRLFEAAPDRPRVSYLNVALGVPGWVRRARFDVIALHTTVLCARWFARAADVRRALDWVAASPALKLALPQDEYDHSAVLDDWLTDLGVSVIGTNFGPAHRSALYPRASQRARFIRVLTGYIDDALAGRVVPALRPAAARPLDLVYRASRLPYWFGHHGQLKHRVGTAARSAAAELGLRADVSVEPGDTIQSNRWYDFLASGRATVGCESGSSALDRRGEIQAAVRALLTERPDLSFEEVSARLPAGWDAYRFYALGPRHLEAVLTRTCQILVEGEYDGLFQAGAHYVPVRRDLANLADALAVVRDSAAVDRMTLRAYEDLFLAGKLTYAAAARALGDALDIPASPRSGDRWLAVRLRVSAALRLAGRVVRGGWRRLGRKFGRGTVT